MTAFPCVKCQRWKLFNEAPCAQHPDFKTAKDIAAETEAAEDQRLQDSMDVLMFTSALRTMAAMGRADLLENVIRNLETKSDAVKNAVTAEVVKRGLMTSEEMSDSLFAFMELRRKVKL